MHIKPATVADLASCGPAAREFYASSKHLKAFDLERFCSAWKNLLESGVGTIFLLWHEGAIVGAIGGVVYPEMYSDAMVAQEFFWFVSPKHRGQGADLYRAFEQWARENGATEIRMGFLHDSMPERLTVVYKRWGFQPIETNWAKELNNAA